MNPKEKGASLDFLGYTFRFGGFCQVGCFVELCGPQRAAGQAVLKLVRVRRPRDGFGYAVGFPVRRVGLYEQRAVAAGKAVVFASETARSSTHGDRTRRVVRMVAPARPDISGR